MEYHKIQTVFLRDPETKYKTLLIGHFARQEFEYLVNNNWIFTEKIDGTNIRVDWNLEKRTFGGRTDRTQIPAFLYSELEELFPIELFKSLYPEMPMTLYGEGYGAKIQKGGGNYIPGGVSFILFDVMIGGLWLERQNVEDIAEKLQIDVVPVVGEGTLWDAINMAEGGFHSRIGNQEKCEGLVMRPQVEMLDRRGRRIISKIKHKDF